jgi:hypothetical protein
MKPDHITYKVSCLLAKGKAVAFITPDRINHSVHLHFFGEMLSTRKTPIQVKHADMKFPDGADDEIVRQVITDYGPIAGLQIQRIVRVKDNESTMEGIPARIIVRFKK